MSIFDPLPARAPDLVPPAAPRAPAEAWPTDPITVFRIVWRDRQGLHVGAPRFFTEDKAQRWRRLLLRDPAVTEARVVPLIIRPILPLPKRPA